MCTFIVVINIFCYDYMRSLNNLADCDWLTDEGVRALAPLTNITSLNLAHCREVTDKGVRSLAPLTAITSLNLLHCTS
jgi:hypothetical protein